MPAIKIWHKIFLVAGMSIPQLSLPVNDKKNVSRALISRAKTADSYIASI